MSASARRELIAGLRAVADFYEGNAGAYYDGMDVVLRIFSGGRHARRDFVAMANAFGEWRDRSGVQDVVIAKDFSAKVRVEFFCPRAKVCRLAVLGSRLECGDIAISRAEFRDPDGCVEGEGCVRSLSPGYKAAP